jgi:hypothetical protein
MVGRYARSNEGWDKDGNYKHVDPYTGNIGIGYVRMNVKVEQRPRIEEVSLEQDVDCLRGS